MKAILHSGGSEGADKLFGELAEETGHQVNHYSFLNHKSSCRHLVFLNEFQLSEGNKPLAEANKILKRRYPTSSWYVNNLLKRNYFQIKESNRIYAVTPLDKEGLPTGGTGWAIIMGMLKGIKSIYVYDVNAQAWFSFESYDPDTNTIDWNKMDVLPPKPFGAYAGIGSHDLPELGAKAIRELYTQAPLIIEKPGFEYPSA